MNDINIFFNNKFTILHADQNGIENFEKISFSEKLLNAGDWFLSPVRCLFNGREVKIAEKTSFSCDLRQTENISDDFEFQQHDFAYNCSPKPKRSLDRVIKAIVLFIPGLLIGAALKALAYTTSTDIKNLHEKISLHYQPRDLNIGSEEHPVTFKEFSKDYNGFIKNNKLGQRVNALTIYTTSQAYKEEIEIFMLDKRTNADIKIIVVKEPASVIDIQIPAEV